MNIRLLFGLLCVSTAVVHAQMISIMDGTSPPAVQAGAPTGSFALSGFESVNPYSGHLNFTLPLRTIGGRGEAGFQLQLPIERNWHIENHANNGVDIYIPVTDVVPTSPSWGSNFQVYRYTPGRVIARAVSDPSQTPMMCAWGGTPNYQIAQGKTLTRITYVEANGTEHELLDTLTFGRPATPLASCAEVQLDPRDLTFGFNRGRIFSSHDGSAMTFVADSEIHDPTPYYHRSSYGMAGWLELANGTKFHFTGGDSAADQIVDRNGNTSRISYGTNGFTITDAIGRVTTVAYADFSSTFNDTISYIGYSATRTITVHWSPLGTAQNTLSGAPDVSTLGELFPMTNGSYSDGGKFAPYVVAYVALPDDRPDNVSRYTFQYNIYGELTRAVLPTGGAYEYDYPATAECTGTGTAYCATSIVEVPGTPANDPAALMTLFRRVKSRAVKSNGSTVDNQTFFYPSYTSTTTTVTVDVKNSSGALLTRTIHSYVGDSSHPRPYALSSDANSLPYPDWNEGLEGTIAYHKVEAGAVQKTVSQTWAQRACVTGQPICWAALNGNTVSIPYDAAIYQVNTTLSEQGSITSGEIRLYDEYSNVMEKYEFDYNSAPTPTASYPIPSATTPCAAYSTYTRCTREDYLKSGYEQLSLTPLSPPNLLDPNPNSNHIRNLRSCTRVYGPNAAQESQTDFTYDQGVVVPIGSNLTGHLDTYNTSSVNGRGNLTATGMHINSSSVVSFTLANTFDAGGNIRTATDGNGQPTTITYEAPDYAFPRQVCKGSYCFTRTPDPNTGQTTQQTDLNGVNATLEYDDSLDRITRIVRGYQTSDAEQTRFLYQNSNTLISTLKDKVAFQDGLLRTDTVLDGLGREVGQRTYEGAGYICVDTIYDVAGRVYRVSNPYRQGDRVYTTTTYDSFNRVMSVATGDSDATPANRAATTYSYANNITTSTDPAQKSRSTTMDALGRLRVVTEDPQGSAVNTTYTYNAHDSLLTVHQPGGLSDRTFTYDWLQRLTSAVNPESNTVNYTWYDNNGNLRSKTDARGVQTTMTYDILDHLRTKTYVPESYGSAVTYTYDTNVAIEGDTETNHPIGRLVAVSNADSSSIYRYDALGRIRSNQQTTDGHDYVFAYGYQPQGMSTMTYPSQRQVAYDYDSAGRVSQVRHGGGNDPYATSIAYSPHGAVQQLTLGNGILEVNGFNTRMQAHSLAVGSLLTMVWSHCPDGNSSDSCSQNNGNLLGQTITAGGHSFQQAFSYDAFNRITSAGETNGGLGWTQSYVPDRNGNTIFSGAVNGGSASWAASSFDISTNRVAGWQYDLSGNVTGPGFATLQYDAENHQKSYQDASGSAAYTYDGEGRRVKAVVSGVTTVFVYDAQGNLAAEYGGAGSSPSGRQYLSSDFLGSTRLVSDASQAVIRRLDYGPYGEEILALGCSQQGSARSPRCDVAGYTGDLGGGPRLRFTGKERDAETGLDYFGARYFSGAQGRFTSPDPLLSSGRPWEPQSWNRYAYTLNNPLRYTDPLGLYEWDKKCKQGDSTCEANRQQFRDSLANLTKAAGNYAEGSKERKQLDAIIAKIGTEGDGNKTRIGFNANMKDFGVTFGNKMTFNFQAMNNALSQWDSGTVSAAGAALVGHEGQHLVEGTGGVSGLKYFLNMGDERVKQELQPFTVESYVFQSFNKLEPFGYGVGVSKGDANGWPLWNPSWAAADADKLRQANVQKVVEELYGKKK